jgi:signal transduction histidine kinase
MERILSVGFRAVTARGVAAIGLALMVALSASPAAARALNVLLISSFPQDLPASRAIEGGLSRTLKGHHLYVEHLDAPRLSPSHSVPATVRMIPAKYAGVQFDAVVAWGYPAAEVAAGIRAFAPKAALHLAEVTPEHAADLDISKARFHGFSADYLATLEEARRITGAERVVVVGTTDPTGMIRVATARKALGALPTMAVEEWLDQPLDEVGDRLTRLPPKTMVLYLLMFSDGKGTPLTPYAAVSSMAEKSASPIFTPWESLLGSGVVGGKALSQDKMGANVGAAILAPDTAEPAGAIRTVYDWRQLERWGLDEAALGPDAVILYRSPSLLREYRGVLSVASLIVLASIAVSIFLGRAVRARDAALTALADERAVLADRVRDRTTELARSNAELEQFAYAISHDLRQPLRMISGHLGLLRRRLGTKLDADLVPSMDIAVDGAKRLDAMILSLLDYSRVGRGAGTMEWIESRMALDEALSFLAPEIAGSRARIGVVGAWPRVLVIRDAFERVLLNLVGNALKYRAPETAPEIEISVAPLDREWLFAVRDNGIGISAGGAANLFQVFQRLVGPDQYEGTGVGLALCRRIVEAHSGRIWVESDGPGTGSRFCFTLPRQSEPDTPEA